MTKGPLAQPYKGPLAVRGPPSYQRALLMLEIFSLPGRHLTAKGPSWLKDGLETPFPSCLRASSLLEVLQLPEDF